MSLTERSVAGFPILDLSGRLTGSLGNEMLVRVQEIAAAGGREVLLNLASVSYIDSEGLGTMAAAVSALRRNAGALGLLNPSPAARELLRITALNSVMELYDSEVSALDSMLGPQRRRAIAGDVYTQATSIQDETNGVIDTQIGELLVPEGVLRSPR